VPRRAANDDPDDIQVRALPRCRGRFSQRSSTGDRNPAAGVIGVSSWPAACRKISSVWVARAAPVETNAA
jgi:hypothetical protein